LQRLANSFQVWPNPLRHKHLISHFKCVHFELISIFSKTTNLLNTYSIGDFIVSIYIVELEIKDTTDTATVMWQKYFTLTKLKYNYNGNNTPFIPRVT
jgi:hypothetical protein